MKTSLILWFSILFLAVFDVEAVAPYGIKGQAQTGTLYSNVHQAPNNQVTNLGGINALIETGNNNLLANPSFEHLTYNTGWTNTGGTAALETTVVVQGKKSYKSTQSATFVSIAPTDSTLYAAQFADDSVQGLASVRVKAPFAVRICARKAGVTTDICSQPSLGSNKWEYLSIPFVLGATSNGFELKSDAAVTGVMYVDDAFVGPQRVVAETSVVGPWKSYTPTVSYISGSPSNVTHVGKWRQVGDSVEVEVTSNFSATSSAFNTPVYALPAGLTFDTSKMSKGSTNQTLGYSFSVNSGSNSYFGDAQYYLGGVSVNRHVVVGADSGTDGPITNTLPFTFDTGDFITVKFSGPVTQFAASTNTLASTNGNTSWASCGHTAADFTAWGTVTNIATLCKRDGDDLLMRGNWTSGTSTGAELRLALKFNGQALTSKGSPVIPSIQGAGDMYAATFATTYFGSKVLIEPSVQYVTFGHQSSTTAPFTKSTGAAGSVTHGMVNVRIPIAGWENSNIIVANLSGLEKCADTYECTDTFRANLFQPTTIDSPNVPGWITALASSGTGSQTKTVTVKSGLFTVKPSCTCTPLNSSTTTDITCGYDVTNSTASSLIFYTTNNGVANASGISIACGRGPADYIGKTAKAVASDQNVRAIGSIGVDIQSVTFGSGANCATACTTGTCTICRQTGNKISSVQWLSTGVYRVFGIDGTKYTCYGGGFASTYTPILQSIANSTSTYVQLDSSGNSSSATVNCWGIP